MTGDGEIAINGEAIGVTLYLPDGNLRPLEEIEADVIRLAIGHYRGRMTEVARRLGIGRSTLYRKLGDWGSTPRPDISGASPGNRNMSPPSSFRRMPESRRCV